MTIASTKSSITLVGNGVNKTWDFDFRVWTVGQVALWITDPDGLGTELTSNFSVTLNADQDVTPGGAVTYPVSGSAIAAGYSLSILRDMDFLQGVDLQKNQGFDPAVLEAALDQATAERQQLKEAISRAISAAPGQSAADFLGDLVALKDAAAGSASAAETARGLSVTAKDSAVIAQGLSETARDAAIAAAASVPTAANEQVQAYTRFTAGGTADAITGTLTPAVTTYTEGLRVTTIPTGPNLTTAPTLNVGTPGAVTIFKRDSGGSAIPLAPGDMNASGPADFQFDAAYSRWILLNPIPTYNTTGFRNKIYNAAMAVWQRGTSIPIVAGQYTYSADRMCCYRAASAVGVTLSQQSTGGLSRLAYALRIQRNSGDTSTAGLFFSQSLETVDSLPLAGKTVTFSFWARVGANFSASGSQIGVVVATGTGTDQNCIGTYTGEATPISTTQALTTSWTRYQYTATLSASATEVGFRLTWTPSGTAGANDYVEFTGIQLEEGYRVSDFYSRPYGDELRLCQRYYYRSQPGSGGKQYGSAWGNTTTAGVGLVNFPVNMRIAPTTLEQSGTAAHYAVYLGAANYVCNSVPVFGSATTNGAYLSFPNAGTMTVGQAGYANSQNAAGYLGFSAEI